ncbi:uncharacterized protein LOC144106580 [Amblyomma americanum]
MPSAATKKYQVPDGFCAVTNGVALPAEEVSADEHRVWLIQTPNDVNISNLDGVKISLRGGDRTSVQIGEDTYEFLKRENHSETQKLSISVQDETSEQITLVGGTFAGMATLMKEMTCLKDLPAPSSPKKLQLDYSAHESARQRFVPFGSEDVMTMSKKHKDRTDKDGEMTMSKKHKDRTDKDGDMTMSKKRKDKTEKDHKAKRSKR